MNHRLVTAPTEEPVSLDDVHDALVITTDRDDNLLQSYIAAAREYVESPGLNRALLTQTWDLSLDRFPSCCQETPHREILLPRPPLQSVTWIKYIDTAGAEQTLSASTYLVDTISEPARIVPVYGAFWPDTQPRINAVSIRYVAGWDAASKVPQRYKQAILFLVAHWYEHREPVFTGSLTAKLDFTVQSLLGSDKIGALG